MTTTSVATPNNRMAPNPLPPLPEPEQLIKKVADGAIFVSDVLVGNGDVPKAGTKLTRFEEFRRFGVLGYATSVATESAKLTGTLWATGLTAFSPINWLNPVQWSVQLTSLPYWLSTAQLGEETWGKMAAGPVACASGMLLGTARAPAHRLRELEADYFPDSNCDGDIDAKPEHKPAPKPEAKDPKPEAKPSGKKPEVKGHPETEPSA